MGRYLRGTAGFTYTYVVASQPANLDLLASTAGCGRGGIEPLLSASMRALETTLDVPVLALLRALVLRTGSADGFVEVLYPGDVIPSDRGEDVGFATGAAIVGLISLLDERLPAVAEDVRLRGRGTFEIERDEYPSLLAYVNEHMPVRAQLRLDRRLTAAELDAATAELGDADAYLPRLALCILDHAVAHGLDRVAVAEEMPELTLGPSGDANLWQVIRESWGPPEILADTLPDDADAVFARGLIEYWRGAHATAAAALRHAHERGDARAYRWLAALGVEVTPPSRPAPPRAHRHDAAALEAALAHREELEASADATRALARAQAARDPEELTTVLARWPFGVPLAHEPASEALSAILGHGDPLLIGRACVAVAKRVDREAALGGHLAYNLACGAAVLGWKDEMLAWLRAAKRHGDHPRDALADRDFASYHDDPDLRALADEP